MAKIWLDMPGAGPPIHRCVSEALERIGHTVSGVDPDMRIGIWQVGMPVPVEGPPLVRWWTGSDVGCLAAGRTSVHSHDERLNWVGCERLRHELACLGLAARTLPIVPAWDPLLCPMPDRPRVMAYCPDGSEALYRWGDVCYVIDACPEFDFAIYRKTLVGERLVPPNVTMCGTVCHDGMLVEYLRSSAVLRLVQSDGASLSVLEALTFGRHVVWSHVAMPGCRQADDWYQAAVQLRAVLASGEPNVEGFDAMVTLRRAADGKLAKYVGDVIH